jgi:protein-S-isoprenylcysteine O-methyltransferase Ste14
MPLREELEKQGKWLFRWRSYIPLLLLPFLYIALRNPEYVEQAFGETVGVFYKSICFASVILGLVVRWITIGYAPQGTSGRNKRKQKAETLNTTGMYSIVRHPLYFGNFIIFLGMLLYTQVWWFVVIGVLAFWLYYERIFFTEEEFLREKFGEIFLTWSQNTPAFFPKIKRWQRPNIPFSFKTVFQREYSGFFLAIAAFAILEFAQDLLSEGVIELDVEWIIAFAFGLLVFLVLRTLRKMTKLFEVEGR